MPEEDKMKRKVVRILVLASFLSFFSVIAAVITAQQDNANGFQKYFGVKPKLVWIHNQEIIVANIIRY